MSRNQTYYVLNEKLSYLSNDYIKKIIQPKKNKNEKTYGINKVVTFNDTNIFIKAIPIAKKFVEAKFDTKNLYKIPAYYNYGFGSAGVNPWRELLLHIKTTNWVLIDKCDFFPLLYHYRIIEDDDTTYIESGLDSKILNIWDHNDQIVKYLQDRIKSKYKIVMFLEYIPNVAWKYLQSHSSFTENFYNQTLQIVEFLSKNGILHNDAHLGNYLVDENKKVYLTDFGISLSTDFELDKHEKKFIKYNYELDKFYAYDNIMSNYINKTLYSKKINKKYKLDLCQTTVELAKYIVDYIDKIKSDIDISKFEISFIKDNSNLLIKYIEWKKNFKKTKNKSKYFIIQN